MFEFSWSIARYMLKHGQAVKYHRHGRTWIVKYNGEWYEIGRIDYDRFGTPYVKSISENQAKINIAIHSSCCVERSWSKAQKLFGWEPLDEYYRKYMADTAGVCYEARKIKYIRR